MPSEPIPSPRRAAAPPPPRTPQRVAGGAAALVVAVALGLGLAALAGCGDPTRDALIETLGGESPGVPIGPLHRPGQPCVVCHDGDAARAFAIAGTVYWTASSKAPAPGTRVDLVDADGGKQFALTNCAGNFFVLPENLEVAYPFWVKLSAGDAEITMDSPVNGDGSCASCHEKTFSARSAGRVYLHDTPPGPPPESCP